MSIRQAISELSAFLKSPPKPWRPPRMIETAANLSRRASLLRSPVPEEELDSLEKKFLTAIETNEWTHLDQLDWQAITFYLWTSPRNFLSIHRFHFNYRRHLESSKTARPIKHLIHAYLQSFDPQREGIEWAGGLIRKILMQNRFAVLVYWREAESAFHLFSTSPGPQKFAARCLDHPLSVFQLQHDLGLKGTLATGGYARQAYLAASQIIRSSPWVTEAELLRLERFLEWSRNDPPQPFLRFPDLGQSLLQTLLGTLPPSPRAREYVGKFFTKYGEAWRKGDTSCVDPTPEQIKVVGQMLGATE